MGFSGFIRERQFLSNVSPSMLEWYKYSFKWLDTDERVVNRLEVIFEEVVSNTVRHGFEPGSEQSIQVKAEACGERLELVFEDDGTPFDPLRAKAPEPFQSLETARLGGLGIPLVTRLSTALRYERPAATAAGFAPTNRLSVTISTRI